MSVNRVANRVRESYDGYDGYDVVYNGRVYPFNFESSAWKFLLSAEEDDLTDKDLKHYVSYPEGEEPK